MAIRSSGAAIFGSLWRARQSRNVTTYGSARWAKPGETERAGLHRDAGVFLGKLRGRYLRHDGPEHVMAFAPTRSGKGVGLVIPTLLSWTGSAVIHDIKGENWQLTAGWRSRFSHVLLFNPTDPRSAKYNPLLEVRRGENEVRDVQNIADILVDPEGAQFGGVVFDPQNYSQNILTAARTLQQINNQIQSLQNEATMLINQAKNLTRIDFPAPS